jgi:hypothetical protein
VRQPLLDRLAKLDKQALIIKRAAAAGQVAADVADVLVRQASFGGGHALLDVLLGTATGTPSVALARFAKQALLANRLALAADELLTIQAAHTTLGWLDWSAFPVDSTKPAIPWSQLAGLLQYVALRKQAPRGRAPLWQLFSEAAAPVPTGSTEDAIFQQFLLDLAARTGWETVLPNTPVPPSLKALADVLGLTRPSFVTISGYVALGAAVALANRMGLPGATIGGTSGGWRVDVTPALAADIKGAARSKHAPTEWLTIAKALRDPLRQKQRDALLDYIQTLQTYVPNDANGVLDYYLIDVQMSSCMLTSRIKQAIGSTQMFIERCLLGAEPTVPSLPPEAAWQWKWMRDYRVWEANREVFLYPENWLQPELRTDKTQYFKELEDELHQKQLTTQAVEDAVHHYLEKLDRVAKLDIAGFVMQGDAFNALDGTSDTSALHVIGRTAGSPQSYFYRRLERGWHWTAWEDVQLDISSDQLLPIIWHRRLFLFWLRFHEKTDPSPSAPTITSTPDSGGTSSTAALNSGATLPVPTKHLEITLVWSELKSDRWTPRRMSTQTVIAAPADSSYIEGFVLHGYIPKVPVGEPNPLHVQVVYNGTLNGAPGVIAGTQNTPNDGSSTAAEFVFGSCTSEPQVVPFATQPGRPVTAPTNCIVAGQFFDESAYVGDTSALGNLAALFYETSVDANQIAALSLFKTPPESDDSLYLMRGNGGLDEGQGDVAATPSHMDEVLQVTPGLFTISWPHEQAQAFSCPVFFSDQQRSFYVTPIVNESMSMLATPAQMSPNLVNYVVEQLVAPPAPPPPQPQPDASVATISEQESPDLLGMLSGFDSNQPHAGALYQFADHHHPYACAFLERLDQFGVDGFYAWNDDPAQPGLTPIQLLAAATTQKFGWNYRPTSLVQTPFPDDEVDFSPCGAYSQYNWELFLHIPVYVANRMRTEQNFEEALRWLHFIFDPKLSNATNPSANWKMLRLRQEDPTAGNIVTLLRNLAEGKDLGASGDCEAETLTAQIALWRHDPFDPHAIARLRPTAYMKWVFNLYVQTLIDWGDMLFRQNTIESINLATLRYVMAAEILGDRPDPIPLLGVAPPMTYADMLKSSPGIDAFSDEIENIVPATTSVASEALRFDVTYGPSEVFCVPPNDQLYALWDTVADRLNKIRHCMNIQGRVQQLPLFEPPINPAQLIAGMQAGVDLQSAVNQLNAPMPRYRFSVVYERARELVGELRTLGNALLSALEKSDGEQLAVLRSSNEVTLLKAVRDAKQKQVDEATASHDALVAGQAAMEARVTYYQQKSAELANLGEITGMELMAASQIFHIVSQGIHMAAGATSMIPQFKIGVSGFGGTPYVVTEIGGQQIKGEIDASGIALEALGGAMGIAGSVASTIGGWQRRQDDVTMQATAGASELEQIASQLVAAQTRMDIAQKELDNQDTQIDQASAVYDFLQSKFSNQQLYDWMAGQLSAVYLQTYQLAFDMARLAEQAFRFELGLYADTRTFIQFGYWDNLKQGLLAGDRLAGDLVKLQATYIEENKRELELTKHISLALIDPIALLALRQTGTCYISLGEQLFDLDMPGLYMRRIKTLAISVPCVSGSYTSVNMKLTLVWDSIRTSAATGASSQFVNTPGGTQAIVTSTAQNDAGLFDVNLRDDRYLPFEGAGVISRWKLELVPEAQQFDWSTISDIVLHMRYTARDGGADLYTAAKTGLSAALQKGLRLFSVRDEFPDALAAMLNTPTGTSQTLTLPLGPNDFPYPVQKTMPTPNFGQWLVLVRWSDKTFGGLKLTLTPPGGTAQGPSTAPPSLPTDDDLQADWQEIATNVVVYKATGSFGTWTLTVGGSLTDPTTGAALLGADKVDPATGLVVASAIDDIIVLVNYGV